MNALNELNEHLRNGWDQLKDAAKNEDWPAMQRAFREMATVQDLDERSRNLQQQIAGLSHKASPNGNPTLTDSTPFTPVHHFDGRRGTTRPRELRIGAHHVPISINNQIVIATANWIIAQGKTLPRIHNFVHPTNSGFSSSAQIKRLD